VLFSLRTILSVKSDEANKAMPDISNKRKENQEEDQAWQPMPVIPAAQGI
jgi:hypothetical protein